MEVGVTKRLQAESCCGVLMPPSRVHPAKVPPLTPQLSGAPRQGWTGRPWRHGWPGSVEGQVWPVLLVLLEVELGDHEGVFGPVGEADRLVSFQRRADEPARADCRLKAGGGAVV